MSSIDLYPAPTRPEPRHRDASRTVDMVPTKAVCTCYDLRRACPRHEPISYADAYARHATDSIGPFTFGALT